MLQPFFDWIEKFATDFTWRRLIIFLSFLALLGGCLAIYESLTSHFQLRKYEKAIGLIEKMQGVEKANPESEKVINNVYAGLLEITTKREDSASLSISFGDSFKQLLAASAVWMLFALFFAANALKGDASARYAVIGVVALGALVGFGGYMLPTSLPDWITFGLYPVGINLVLILWFASIGNRTK